MGKIYIILIIALFLIGCTQIELSAKDAGNKIVNETKNVENKVMNETGNKTGIINSIGSKVAETVSNANSASSDYDTPSVINSRIVDETDVSDFGEVI